MTDIDPDPPPASERDRVPRYEPTDIEPRWQQRWADARLHRTDLRDTSRPQVLPADDVPLPVGRPAHRALVHHARRPTRIARFRRMNGDNVFFPIGFDAFGLPAENAAIKSGVHPAEWTMRNIENMRAPVPEHGRDVRLGERGRHLPARLLPLEPVVLPAAPRGRAWPIARWPPVDWCPKDQVVLAREQVEGPDRVCWRCGTQVIKRDLEQWFFRITKYADELLDFTGIDWPEPVRVMQTNWIGRSEGAEVVFTTAPSDAPRGRRGAARLHDPAGHAVRGHVHGPGAGASAGRER